MNHQTCCQYLSTRPFGIVAVSGEQTPRYLYRVDVRWSTRRRPRCLEPPHDCNGVLRLRPHSVVAVEICRPDPSVLVDDLEGRHRQSKVGLMRSEEHTSELQSRYVISYAVFCLKKK